MQDWQSNIPIWLTFPSASQLPQDTKVFQCIVNFAPSFATTVVMMLHSEQHQLQYQAPLHTLAPLIPHLTDGIPYSPVTDGFPSSTGGRASAVRMSSPCAIYTGLRQELMECQVDTPGQGGGQRGAGRRKVHYALEHLGVLGQL